MPFSDTRLYLSHARPAQSYAEARRLVERLHQLDGAGVAPGRETFILDHGCRQPLAVVLLHGLTNSPPQMRSLAEQVHARGANVLVPRLPQHGLTDRLTRRQAELTAEELLDATEAAVDAAGGLGEQVVVAGFSLGGVLAGWVAQHREGVQRAVLIAPAFGVFPIHPRLTGAMAGLLRRGPSMFWWWDPRKRERLLPKHVYPWVSTRALGQTLRLGRAVHVAAQLRRPCAEEIILVAPARDPAISRGAIMLLANAWRERGATVTVHRFGRDLPIMHNIVDPGEPGAPLDKVLPALVPLILGDQDDMSKPASSPRMRW